MIADAEMTASEAEMSIRRIMTVDAEQSFVQSLVLSRDLLPSIRMQAVDAKNSPAIATADKTGSP